MTITPSGRRLGAHRRAPDARDAHYNRAAPLIIPQSIDLEDKLPPAWDQGQLGSCEAHAGAAMMAFLFPGFEPSRLKLYFDALWDDGNPGQDVGTQTRTMLKVMQKHGAAPESDWPYDPSQFAVDPPAQAIVDSGKRRIGSYTQLVSANDILTELAHGNPFMLSFQVPMYFDYPDIANHGIFTLPGDRRVDYLGGHAVTAVGYDLDFKSNPDFLKSGVDPSMVSDTTLKIRNSWGNWGIRGHFYMPLGIAINPSTGGDCWSVSLSGLSSSSTGPSIEGIPITGTFV